MKWALIILLGSSGNWDTGLTYRSFEACASSATEIFESQQYEQDDFEEGYTSGFYHSLYRDNWKCLPTK